jgi:hypothetical protein
MKKVNNNNKKEWIEYLLESFYLTSSSQGRIWKGIKVFRIRMTNVALTAQLNLLSQAGELNRLDETTQGRLYLRPMTWTSLALASEPWWHRAAKAGAVTMIWLSPNNFTIIIFNVMVLFIYYKARVTTNSNKLNLNYVELLTK